MRTQDAVHRSNQKKGKGAVSASSENAASLGTYSQQTQDASLAAPSRDELTAISGIDSTIEMALNSFGIHRYEDFERWTPEQLANGLMRLGIGISSEIILQQNWIGQSLELAGKSPKLNSSALETTGHLENKITQGPEVQVQAEVKPTAPQPVPQLMKEMIEQKEEKRKPEVKPTPPQLAPAPISEKINEKIKLQSQPVADEAAVLQIKSARFAQQSATAGAGQSSEKKLRSEIVCELAAAKVSSKKAEPMTLCTQIHAVDLTTGASELLASKSQSILQAREKYQSTIDFETPNTGRYRLQVVAMLLGAQPMVAMYRGPILRVEG